MYGYFYVFELQDNGGCEEFFCLNDNLRKVCNRLNMTKPLTQGLCHFSIPVSVTCHMNYNAAY